MTWSEYRHLYCFACDSAYEKLMQPQYYIHDYRWDTDEVSCDHESSCESWDDHFLKMPIHNDYICTFDRLEV